VIKPSREARALAVGEAERIAIAGSFAAPGPPGFPTSTAAHDISVAVLRGPSVSFARVFGDSDDRQTSLGVAFAPGGEVVATANFYGTVDFGFGVSPTGVRSGVVRLDANGTVVAASGASSPWLPEAHGVAVAPDGSIYLTGFHANEAPQLSCARTTDYVENPDGGAPSAPFAYVAKFGPEFSCIWQVRWPGWGEAVGIHPSTGEIIVAGGASAAFTMGQSVVASYGGEDVLVARLGVDGSPRWARALGGPGNDFPTIAGILEDRVVLTATYVGSFALGSGDTVVASGGTSDQDALLVVLDGATGDPLAAPLPIHGPDKQFATATVLADETIAVAGYFETSVRIADGPPLTGPGTDQGSAFLERINLAGTMIWQATLTGPGIQEIAAIRRASDGTLVVSGTFDQTLELGGALTLQNSDSIPHRFVAGFAP
jgi:hypothetical protein